MITSQRDHGEYNWKSLPQRSFHHRILPRLCVYSPFGERCKSLHEPRAKGFTDSWLRHTKFPLCNKALDLDTVPYIDHLQSVTSEIIHHGNPMGVNLSSKLRTDQFEDFYQRITNSCDGIGVLNMKIAGTFLADSPKSLLKFTPTHTYLGQICSVQSKCFAVSLTLEDEVCSLQEIPFSLSLVCLDV